MDRGIPGSDVAGGRRVALAVAAAALLAWTLLFALDHRLVHAFHRPGATGTHPASPLGQAAVFALAWLVMTVAMMLPTTLPLLRIFRRMTTDRPGTGQLLALLAGGYLSAWLLFGLLAGSAAVGVRQALDAFAEGPGWLLPSLLLALAGAFQLSDLKDRCLQKCRSPFLFVARRWEGGSERRQSFRLGWEHGLFCVGCCWALMTLMFAVGTGAVGWMLLLAVLMAAEKNTPWGLALVRPAGVALLLGSASLAAFHVFGL